MTDTSLLSRHDAEACFEKYIDEAVVSGEMEPTKGGRLKERLHGAVAELDRAYDVEHREGEVPDDPPNALDVAVTLSMHVNEAAYVGAIDDATKRGLHSDLDAVVVPVLGALED